MNTLYRADVPGLRTVEGLTSWTGSKEHALDHAERFGAMNGRLCLYRAEIEPGRVLDGRPDLRYALDEVGLDLDDYLNETPQDLCRALANVFRAHGYQWVAFRERAEPEFDEWLYLGQEPVPVVEHAV